MALDFSSAEEALALVERLAAAPIGMYKVGSELFTAAGPGVVERLVAAGHDVFLDLKFHDIPNTVAGAVRSAARLGVRLLNVHASGGLAMMRAAIQAARSVSPGLRVIGVTVLTSLQQDDLAHAGIPSTPAGHAVQLASLASEAGLDGVVASALEVASLRARFPRPFLLVTPGIRPAWTGADVRSDQKRVATPETAIGAGADFIVVGRPITAAADPLAAARQILSELSARSATRR